MSSWDKASRQHLLTVLADGVRGPLPLLQNWLVGKIVGMPDQGRSVHLERELASKGRDGESVMMEPSDVAGSAEAATVSTLISTLVFLGDVVYKFRNPIHFGFLDLSSAERRRRDCEREVLLNRRLAPDIYLGVAEVRLSGMEDEPVVVMRRLPATLSLDRLATKALDLGGESRAIAKLLVDFHERAERSPGIDNDASPASIAAKWSENFAECSPFIGTLLDSRREEAIQYRVWRFLRGREELFRERVALGRICDGHGDLQASDIFCLEDGPRILDCLEFDDRLRHIDVVDDLSFLAMDLDRIGAKKLAADIIKDYEEFSGEVIPNTLCDFYRAYHAYVRSKVACLRSSTDVDARHEAQRLHGMALSYLERSRVQLVMVGGLPGTGKSTLASSIASRIGAIVLRTDEVRREMFSAMGDPSDRYAYREGLYSDQMTNATYQEVLRRTEVALGHGTSVVLDGSWNAALHRAQARSAGQRMEAEITEFQCVADATLAERRIEARRSNWDNVSDATGAIAASMANDMEPWPTSTILDTSASPEHVLLLALRALRHDQYV